MHNVTDDDDDRQTENDDGRNTVTIARPLVWSLKIQRVRLVCGFWPGICFFQLNKNLDFDDEIGKKVFLQSR